MKKSILILFSFISLASYSQIQVRNPARTPLFGQTPAVVQDRDLRAIKSMWLPYVNSATPSLTTIDSAASNYQLLNNGQLALSKGLGTGFWFYLPSTVIASTYLPLSGGTITGNLTVNGTLNRFIQSGAITGTADRTGVVTIGTPTVTGSSLFVNTPSLSTSFGSGFGIGGSYSNPGGVGTSVINLTAYGVSSGGGYNSAMAFYTGAAATYLERMRILPNGNVGIGIEVATEKLHVVGKIIATTAPTNPTDVVRKQELDLKANLTDINSFANYTASGNGSATTITVAHGLTGITGTSKVIVQSLNASSAGISYATIGTTNVSIIYTVAPANGTNNLNYSILIKP